MQSKLENEHLYNNEIIHYQNQQTYEVIHYQNQVIHKTSHANQNDFIKIRKSRNKPLDAFAACGSRTIKRFRIEKNLSQIAAATEANLSIAYLSNVERGNHSISLSKFLAFGYAFDGNPKRIIEILGEELSKFDFNSKVDSN